MKQPLDRSLNLTQSTAINMIDMVGIGPFVTIPFVIGAMNGPACIFAWLLGALLSFCDGMVWSELGAKWPQAGGSYQFLKKLYGEKKWGALFSFLYIWQTTFQAPLVIASGAIGFAQYFSYLIPLDPEMQKVVSGSLVIFLTFLLYRRIGAVGRLSVALWIGVLITLAWLIISGLWHFDAAMAFDFSDSPDWFSILFFVGLGQATIKTTYCYLGYYNVCHIGAEIKDPEKNIPRSIMLSIAGISIIYLLMQVVILGVIPWREAKESTFIVSTFFEQVAGSSAAVVATILILWIALASLFAVMLGYSRVPYAAAVDGNYFKVFGRVHPEKHFPHMSLLILGATSFVFSLLFKLKEVITAIIVMRILIQFVSQGVGVILLHYTYSKRKPPSATTVDGLNHPQPSSTTPNRLNGLNGYLPYRMILFPLPAIIAILVWMFIFFSSGWPYILGALGVIASGMVVYYFYKKQ